MIFYVENNTEYEPEFDYEKLLKQVCEKVLEVEQCPFDVEVSLYLVSKEEIQETNRATRDMDKVTDVLSFPNLEFEVPGDFSGIDETDASVIDPESGLVVLGDIVICAAVAVEQAKEYGHSTLREFAFLTAHSMLHLCGYDHMEEDERIAMEARQEEILNLLGITRDR